MTHINVGTIGHPHINDILLQQKIHSIETVPHLQPKGFGFDKLSLPMIDPTKLIVHLDYSEEVCKVDIEIYSRYIVDNKYKWTNLVLVVGELE